MVAALAQEQVKTLVAQRFNAAAISRLLGIPYSTASEMVREIKDAKFKQLGFSYKMSTTPPRDSNPAPALGQNTDELLAALGISEDERARLRQAGVTRMGNSSSD